MKKYLFLIIAVIFVVLVIKSVNNKKEGSSTPDSTTPIQYSSPQNLEFYWGQGCPHCENVEDFLKTWDKAEEVKIEKMEVWYNQENQAKFVYRAKKCQIPENQMGVPLLVDLEEKCYIGDTPIIDYLKSL